MLVPGVWGNLQPESAVGDRFLRPLALVRQIWYHSGPLRLFFSFQPCEMYIVCSSHVCTLGEEYVISLTLVRMTAGGGGSGGENFDALRNPPASRVEPGVFFFILRGPYALSSRWKPTWL